MAKYLESEQGRDVPEAVAVRLRRLPWHVLLPDRTPDSDDVHLLRGLVEQKLLQRRADNDNG
ncbi:MAG: hypothetical protein ABW252_23075 [Polyangiales bacterium]